MKRHRLDLSIETDDEKSLVAPWGEASQRRGLAHLSEALLFITAFPIGELLTVDDFDRWGHDAGLINVPFGYPKTSDTWKGHVARRQQLREQINVSGMHPRIIQSRATPFVIDWRGRDIYEVNSPEQSLLLAGAYPKIVQVLEHTRKKVASVFQATDFSRLPPYERAFADAMHDDADYIAEEFTMRVQRLQQRLEKARHRTALYTKQQALTKPEEPQAEPPAVHDNDDVT